MLWTTGNATKKFGFNVANFTNFPGQFYDTIIFTW